MGHFWNRPTAPRRAIIRIVVRLVVLILVVASSTPEPSAQNAPGVTAQAAGQIAALMREKASRTPAQRKMASRLAYGLRQARRDPDALRVPTLRMAMPTDGDGRLTVDIRADVSVALLDYIRTLGGDVESFSERYRAIRARMPLSQLEALAADPAVQFIGPREPLLVNGQRPPALDGVPRERPTLAPQTQQFSRAVQDGVAAVERPITSVGSAQSQGDITHRAAQARAQFHVSGAGVRIGVLSDGVGELAASQARGDLNAVTVLPGQAGPANAVEGTAMLEIVHDLAPDAELYFATAVNGTASFAQNIRALQAAGCRIIVDDVRYLSESPFQDGQTGTSFTNGGIVAQAVKDVAAAGVLYFSSAGNSGNKNDGTSGTWEGDFLDGGAAGGALAGAGRLHNFGGATFTTMTAPTDSWITLHWSDPLGASTNDYDLFMLDSTGSSVVDFSTDEQSIANPSDPFERLTGGGFLGERVVVTLFSGATRFLHLSTNRGRLSISTAGEIAGHAATTALNSFGVAAVDAQVAYPNRFNTSITVEPYSSDGPRRIFFDGNGSQLTPGVLTSAGGRILIKPDIAAADNVSTGVTSQAGFNPFRGTSAAAPHAAAIAALIQSRNLQRADRVRQALFTRAIDIETFGPDRDAGYGIIMADTGVAAMPAPFAPMGDFDGDGKSDVAVFRASEGVWYSLNASSGVSAATAWGNGADIPVACDYDGDGRSDIAVFRPSIGTWFIHFSSTGDNGTVQWGNSGDTPIRADYDGDGRCDIGVYRRSTGSWYLRFSSTGEAGVIPWGNASDLPVPADYDGDGMADVTIFRPSTGVWYFRFSSTGAGGAFTWGNASDLPVPADYDGDHKVDVAIYRPSAGAWYIRYSGSGATAAFAWGNSSDEPVPGDYDGDGRADLAIFRRSTGTWDILSSATGTPFSLVWGNGSDVPISQRP